MGLRFESAGQEVDSNIDARTYLRAAFWLLLKIALGLTLRLETRLMISISLRDEFKLDIKGSLTSQLDEFGAQTRDEDAVQ